MWENFLNFFSASEFLQGQHSPVNVHYLVASSLAPRGEGMGLLKVLYMVTVHGKYTRH